MDNFKRSYSNIELYEADFHTDVTLLIGSSTYRISNFNILVLMIVQYQREKYNKEYPLLLNDILNFIDIAGSQSLLPSFSYDRNIDGNWNRATILELIVKIGNIKMLHKILEYTPDINMPINYITGNDNINILYMMLDIKMGLCNHIRNKMEILLHHWADVNFKFTHERMTNTPLSLSLSLPYKNKVYLIRMLLDAGADFSVKHNGKYIYEMVDKDSAIYKLFANYQIPLSLQEKCLLHIINNDKDITNVPVIIIDNLLQNKRLKILYDNIIQHKQHIALINNKINTLINGCIISQYI